MKFNQEKLTRLHVDQSLGWQKCRDLFSAMRHEHDTIADLTRRLAESPVTVQAADFKRRGVDFMSEIQREFDELTRRLATAHRTKTMIQAEIERAQAEQERRGQLLEASVEFLRSRGIEPELPDVRPQSILPEQLGLNSGTVISSVPGLRVR